MRWGFGLQLASATVARRPFSALGLSLCLLGVGCNCDSERARAPKNSGSAETAGSAALDSAPLGTLQAVSFAASDGVPLKADLLSQPDPAAPLLVLVHRFRGERTEWKPLLDRLAKAPKGFRVVNADLRGHGESRSATDGKALDWGAMTKDEIPLLERDIEAAIRYGQQGVTPRTLILVGSSLGCTLIARVAAKTPKVQALGLISPGALLEGQDVYTAYAAVRGLSTFFASGEGDNVSRAPMGSLVKMSKRNVLKEYASNRHSAQHLGLDAPALWSDLEEWLMQTYEQEVAPVPPDAAAAPDAEAPVVSDVVLGDGGG